MVINHFFDQQKGGKAMTRKKWMSKRRKEDGKTVIRLSMAIFLSLLVMAAAMANTPEVPAVFTASLDFETQALDLDTGNIVERMPFGLPISDDTDVYMAFNAGRIPHAVIVPVGVSTEIAYMQGVAYDVVTAEDIVNLEFSREPPDLPLAPMDTVVIRTNSGQVFKLGNCEESESWVAFDYKAVQ